MRVRTGVEGFDPIVGGGLPEGASVVLQGPPGNEKDLFGLQFLAEGLRSGEAVVIVISSQSPEQYLESLANLGVNVKEAIAGNRLKVVDWHSYQEENVTGVEERGHVIRCSVDLTNVGIALSRALGTLATGVRRRAVLEVLSPALQVFEVGQVYAFAQSSKAKLTRHKFTALFLLEKEMHSPATISSVSQPFDGVIDIDRRREDDAIVRKIGVLSMKDTASDERFHEFLTIVGRGLIVKPEGPPRPAAALRPEAPKQEPVHARPVAPAPEAPVVPLSNRAAMILRIAEERIRIDPADADALFAKASALASMGDLSGAIGALDALVLASDTYPGLWVLRAKLFARLGDPQSARESRRKADEIARREEAKARTGDTVPCPLCEGAVPVDAHMCPNCGARFIEEVGLAEELDSLGKAAIQDKVGEDLRVEPETGKPADRKPAKPVDRVVEPRVPASSEPTGRRGMTNGLARESLRSGMGRTNGLTNGLKGRTNGLTNGLKGRTNGLKGRTNGLTNGLKGRTNGLTNGLRGRTNGLTNGLRGRTNGVGRTNGITNGLQAGGRTNGLTNGLAALRRGMTNGLTNGNGFTNGLGSARYHREVAMTRWKLYVIPLLSVALLLLPLLGPGNPAGSAYPITIDGSAADWQPAAIASQAPRTGLNANVDILRFGVADNVDYLAFFAEVNGTALRGGDSPPTLDTFRFFIDTDRDGSTGYRAGGLGADRLVEVSGWRGAVNASSLYEWDTNRNPSDWRGWIKAAGVSAAVSGGRIEAQVDWLTLVSPKAAVYVALHTQGFDGSVDAADYALNSAGGSLSIVQTPVVAATIGGANVQLLRLDLSAFGWDVGITGLTVTLTGSAPFSAVSTARLVDGNGTLLDSRIPVDRRISFQFAQRTITLGTPQRLFAIVDTTASSGETLGAILAGPADVNAPGAAVTVRRLASARDVGYLSSVPVTPRIDGGFAEWTAATADPVGDVQGPADPDVDLTGFEAQVTANGSFFYTRVAGRFMAGTWVPKGSDLAPITSASVPDQDRDGVPDLADPFPNDFNNDGTPDSQSGGDYDGDGVLDHGQVGGTDLWLNTTIPATFPAPYANRTVSVYIGPSQEPYRSPDDILRMFIDVDNSTASGYAIGGVGADRMIEVSGDLGLVRASGLFTFAGAYPRDWSWLQSSNVSFALGFDRIELSAPGNLTPTGSRLYLEIGGALGPLDTTSISTRGTRGDPTGPPGGSTTWQSSSFRVASLPMGLQLARSPAAPGTRGSTLIDGNSRAISTLYNHQRKVVRAGDVPADTACDATNSDGCWYAVFYDQVRPIESDWKDGASVAVPTTLGLLDSLATTLAAGDNLIVAIVQLDNTGAAARLITAGNMQLRRGTLTSDQLVSQTQFEVRIAATGAVGDGMLVVLLGKDGAAPASPTYGVFGAADATGLNAEAKILTINVFASGDSAFTDGASVALQSSTTSLGSASTTFPASSASLPSIIIAAIQIDSVSGVMVGPASSLALRRGTLSSSTVIASSQFAYRSPNNAAPDGYSALLVAIDTAGAANQAYSVWALNDDASNTVNGEAKILAFRGLSAASVDTASVAIGTTRTVIGTATTTFPTGDDVVIGAIQLDAVGATRTIAAAADDIRRTGEASGSSNEFTHSVAVSGNSGSGAYQGFVRKVTTTAANPSYEGAATSPAASGLNAELKLVAIHLPTVDDRVVLMRSSDTSGSTWGSQIVLASGNAADSPLLYTFDSSEPSIAIDSGGFLHVVWVSASASGDQSTFDRVRYTRTTVAYPTQSELASSANWEAVTVVDDTATGFMPTVSTDTGNNPHIAWSGSKTSGTVYCKSKAAGSIAFDAATGFAQDAAATSFSFSHTTTGSDRLLIVGVAIRNDASQTVSGVTYAGAALTFLRADTNGASVRTELWYKVAPATGANTVAVTLSASGKGAMGAISLTGVDQAVPVDAHTGATGSSTTPSVSVTTVANGAWVVDAAGFRSTGNAAPTGTAGGGQTERWSGYTEGGGTTPNIRGKGSTEGPKSPAGAVVMDWTLSAAADWSISGASFKPAGIWRATVSWGTTYTGLSVDVSPQNDYVSLARYFEAGTNEIQYTVCKNLSTSNCDAAAEITKADGTAGVDTVATAVESASYPSLATTYETNGDLWVSYAKDNGAIREILARFLDYPSATWAAAETVDSLASTVFTRPSIGIDKDNNVHALYVDSSATQVYYKKRTAGSWSTRTAVEQGTSDNPTIMVRAPNDVTYGTVLGGLYWKTTASETYFYIPEFEVALVPILGIHLFGLVRRRVRRRADNQRPK